MLAYFTKQVLVARGFLKLPSWIICFPIVENVHAWQVTRHPRDDRMAGDHPEANHCREASLPGALGTENPDGRHAFPRGRFARLVGLRPTLTVKVGYPLEVDIQRHMACRIGRRPTLKEFYIYIYNCLPECVGVYGSSWLDEGSKK